MRVHVIYEHEGADLRPYGSSHLRLIRPLSHPGCGIDATFGPEPPADAESVDGVIVDRLWRGNATPDDARALVESQRALGRRVVHALDDDFAHVDDGAGSTQRDRSLVAESLARASDGLLVTTETLRQRCGSLNRRIQVVPNALDERLLARREPRPRRTGFGDRPLVVGVMGTRTHDADLEVVGEAIGLLGQRGDITYEMCGAVNDTARWQSLGFRVREVRGGEEEYPLFMMWWSDSVSWDVGLAPLASTPFNAAKSDVKLLDYAAIGAAGVFSAGSAYGGSVQSGYNGLLAEHSPGAWAEAIDRLASDDALRMALGRRAASELWSSRILAHRAGDWATALREILGS